MKDRLPAYAAGSLSDAERRRVRAHLADCPHCRADLAAWQAIADAAPPAGTAPDPARMVRSVLTRSAIETPAEVRPTRRFRGLAALLVAEARLIRPGVPLASALVIALGVGLALLRTTTGDATVAARAVGAGLDAGGSAGLVLALIAPIVAAAGIAGTYRSRSDPAAELIAAAPTSTRLLLLVRLMLVFGCDLVLAVAASAVLAGTGAAETAGVNVLVGAWLGPMVLLSSLSLLIAVRFGPDVALGAAVGLWAVRVLSGTVLTRDGWPARFIVEVWSTNVPVLAAGVIVAVAAMALAAGEPYGSRRATHFP
ncbi:zf-HC2 domain-containing protein [Cryptosporangium sp. NPDC051539]|uniref:zf-HC2 domain-containing protein n=1 Tax=Cryptosporangium sp. NPDC051539 TaxID=3363962 RepID=UPI0037B0ED7D